MMRLVIGWAILTLASAGFAASATAGPPSRTFEAFRAICLMHRGDTAGALAAARAMGFVDYQRQMSDDLEGNGPTLVLGTGADSLRLEIGDQPWDDGVRMHACAFSFDGAMRDEDMAPLLDWTGRPLMLAEKDWRYFAYSGREGAPKAMSDFRFPEDVWTLAERRGGLVMWQPRPRGEGWKSTTVLISSVWIGPPAK